MLVTLVCGAVIVCLVWQWLKPTSRPVYAAYRPPGIFYYPKKFIFYMMLLLNARRQAKRKSHRAPDRKERVYGASIADPGALDSCQVLEEHHSAIDTTYFNGFGEDGTFVALRVARKAGREGEVWAWLNIPGVGFLQHPLHPDTAVYNMGEARYTAGGLKFEIMEVMRRWRVTYNGLLRLGLCNDVETKPETYLNVKISLKFEATSDPFNFDVDLDKWLLADAIARESWTKHFWKQLRDKHQTHYEQCGELSGTIDVEGYPTKHVRLTSFRDHTFGIRNWCTFHRYAISFIWIEETGMMAMVAAISMPGYISYLCTGYVVYANGETFPVTDVDMDLRGLTEQSVPPTSYSYIFTAGGVKYCVQVNATVTPELYHYRDRQSRVLERFCTYTVNGLAGRGLTEYHYRNPAGPPCTGPDPKSVPLLREPAPCHTVDHTAKLTLPFQHPACGSSQLTGGKGAQLGLLTTIQEKVNFVVPKGFCVTLAVFEAQLKANPAIESHICAILQAIRAKNVDAIKTACTETVHLMSTSHMTPSLEDAIVSQLRVLFGESHHQVAFAVRSSAAGEDGTEASSAGQMETYLGVIGVDRVLRSVRQCWASAYTYQAVEYRRQHGQPIRTLVGVVIQEMVQSEVSGVLFTNDPMTGSQNTMIIDASYGLGEVVVSGKTTPDTITVLRNFDDTLSILHKKIGDKEIRMNVSATGGTEEVPADADTASKCCLTDDQILQLCSIGIKVEQYYGSGRDIEWAIAGGVVYLLQSRPITTFDQESDEDFLHEFDSPMVTGRERITLGNIGEMMPGCVTPLTGSVFWKAIDIGICQFLVEFGGGQSIHHAAKMMVSCCGRLFINLTYMAQVSSNSLIASKEAMEMNLVGEILTDHTLDMIRAYGRMNTSTFSRLLQLARHFYTTRQKVKVANSWYDRLKTYHVGAECTTARDLYLAIHTQLPDYFEVWATTVVKSASSGTWGHVVMGIVSGGNNNWTVDNYADVALLLSHCSNVYSAEVPSSMQQLAQSVVDAGLQQEFLDKDEKECTKILQSNDCDTDLKQKYDTFMERHGHRCIREAEFIEKSWHVEPEKLVKVIKAILKSKAYQHTSPDGPSINECVQKLKSPVTAVGKFLLRRWIVQKARHAVGDREWGKSISIHMVDKFKTAFWRLSSLLVHEGYLPEEELMFFLTFPEIGQLISNRSSRLITRAVRRRKIFPRQVETEFPKTSIGRPIPIQKESVEETRSTSFTLNGMPVSQGWVRGKAAIVLSLDDAGRIEKGDILIVCYTDVGWSPYFPLISGLVTEMGGLVSHGAVVAREYGLPCIVNVPHATRLLKSGDYVEVDGATGSIHKLEDITED